MTVLVQPKRVRMSREEFDRLPEGPPFHDYVNGEAVEVNRASGRHRLIVLRLGNALWEHVRQESLLIEEYQWTGDGFLWVSSTRGGETFQPRVFPGLEVRLQELIGGS